MTRNRYVRIIRFANEGFQKKKYNDSLSFYDIEVTDYTSNLNIIRGQDTIPNLDIHGCYCHNYKFNKESLNDAGILSMRNGHAINVGYLPLNYPVFVRNMRPDQSRIVRVYKNIVNPEDGSIHQFEDDSYWDSYAWIRMNLSLAIQRTEEYPKINQTEKVPENLSEIFLTIKDIDNLKGKRCLVFFFPLKWIPFFKII